MRIGSLCSGYGGLDMAVAEFFNAEVAWFFEYEKGPSKVLAHHWPDVPNYGDLTAADWTGIEQVDIICGGTPCQDLSGAGKRAGMTEGTRSNLWVAMREGIAIQRPRYVIWENVRGAYSASASSEVESEPGLLGGTPGGYLRALGRVVGDLASLGYDSRWVGVRAADAGAPHGRFRVFLLAELADPDSGRRGEPDAGVGTVSISHQDGISVADTRRNEPERWGTTRTVGSPPSSRETDREQRQRIWHTTSDSGTEIAANPYGERSGESWAGTALLTRSEVPDACDPRADTWGDYAPAVGRWERVLGRVAPPPTLPDGKSGNHRLNAAFVEWMMGLAPGHVTAPAIGLTRNEQLKALGNGVVPQQALLALRQLQELNIG